MTQLNLYSENILEGLNPAQEKAVTFGQGPLLIIAGAGTGKTSVITRRIAYLIAEKKCKSSEILALTFTEKAAQEMEERVDILVPYGYTDVMISTFHAFGDFLIKEHALELGLPYDFKVLSDPEKIIFLREYLYELPLKHYRPGGNPASFLEALTSLISRAKDEDISPEEYVKYAEKNLDEAKKSGGEEDIDASEKQFEVAQTYKKYQELMTLRGFIDFGDQVCLVLKLFKEHPSVLKKYRERFKYILVDEFQDTNLSQYKLLLMLAGKDNNLNVVGDDDQSIYKFRGAAISNILNFHKDFPRAEKIVLNANYRSTQNILDAAYKLIVNNNPDRLEVKHNIDKKLTGVKGAGAPVKYAQFDSISSEADFVADYIKKSADKNRYNDFAILVRSNNDALPFIQALNMFGVPYRFSGQGGLYATEEIKLLLSILRVFADPNDSVSLYNLATSDFYEIDVIDLKDCSNLAHKRNSSLFNVFRNLNNLEELSHIKEESGKNIEKIVNDVEKYVAASFNASSGKVLYKFLKEKNLLKNLLDEKKQSSEEKVYNISKFFEVISDYETLYPHNNLPQFMEYLDLLIKSGNNPSTYQADLDLDFVNILTYHKAKGLEFSVVFMVNLVHGKFPVKNRRDAIEIPLELVKEVLPSGDFHAREERRLFYVGMTRAKDTLILSHSLDLGGKRLRKASQFVLEALDMPKAKNELSKSSPAEYLKKFDEIKIAPPNLCRKTAEDRVLALSAKKIDDYLDCPLKYKFVHILCLPVTKHHNIIYGSALHNTISYYFKRKMLGKKVSYDELVDAFNANWVNEGFLSAEHEKQRYENGLQVLRKFYEVSEKDKLLPAHIEKEFAFTIDNIKIIGRWDRIDAVGDAVIITDYKSSDVKDEKDAVKRAKESFQLSLYALAYEKIFNKAVSKVQLYFLENNIAGAVTKTRADIEDTVKIIKEAAGGIRQGNFAPKPGYMNCQYCSYQSLCDKEKR